MGNISSVARGGGEEGQGGSCHSQGEAEDLMGQGPPRSPRGAARLPLLFTPQVRFFSFQRNAHIRKPNGLIQQKSFFIPVAPLQGQEEMHSPSDSRMRNSITYEDVLDDQGIPTMITWTHGGKEVFVEGSWDNWKTKYWRLDLVSTDTDSKLMENGDMPLMSHG
ncbi:hypothetical protein BHE74_00007761 [Ensete ventricosum]|nr:hypothetical protein BHE74_00007761 [Ensete ventricosum]